MGIKTIACNANVAERIRFYRKKQGIFIEVLAKMVGLSRDAIMNYENNRSEPLSVDLKKIAVALEIEADKLYDDYYRFLDSSYPMKIKEIRKERNLSRDELGAMLGLTRHAVAQWEHGRTKIKRDVWEKLNELGFL